MVLAVDQARPLRAQRPPRSPDPGATLQRMKPFRIGAGAGYAGDRIDPAQALAQRLFTQDANVRNVKAFFSLKRAKFVTTVSLQKGGG